MCGTLLLTLTLCKAQDEYFENIEKLHSAITAIIQTYSFGLY